MQRNSSLDKTETRLVLNVLRITLATFLVLALLSCAGMGIRGYRPLLDKGNGSSFKSEEKPADFTVASVSIFARHYATGTTPGARVLGSAVGMIDNEKVVKGSCWDWVNAVYTDAGFPQDKRAQVFMSKEGGPYADPLLLVPGDWIMFKNLTFGNIGHSAIFVGWIDMERRSAMTAEYAGMNRAIPGRYREYDITKCYGILRGK
jgi:hypothetical protein